MKKFYTLLAAAAVIFSASAAEKTLQRNFAKAEGAAITTEFKAAKDLKAIKSDALSRAITPDLEAEGYYISQVRNGSGSWGGGASVSEFVIDGSKATLKGVQYDELTIEGTIEEIDDDDISLVATFPAGQKAFCEFPLENEDGTDYLYDEDGNVMFYRGDIYVYPVDLTTYEILPSFEFWYFPADGDWYHQCNVTEDGKVASVLVFATSTDLASEDTEIFNMNIVMDLLPVNAVQNWGRLYTTAQGAPEDGYYKRQNMVWAEYDDDFDGAQILTIYNFCGSLFNFDPYAPMDFEVDLEAGKAVEYDQAIANQTSAETAFYVWDWDGAGVPMDTMYELTLTPGEDEDGAYTLAEGGYFTIGYMSNATIAKCNMTYMYLPFAIPGLADGIANVTVDSNLPVEYYNLNGVRVKNPSNGLYIRRQGDNVSKIYMK